MFVLPALMVLLSLLVLQARTTHCACVEVDSDTEAVAEQGFKLGCISCKRRAEISAVASVTWSFMARDEDTFTEIYIYEDETAAVLDERFTQRLVWNGSKGTDDVQDGSIYIHNVTLNDTGTFRCFFNRTLNFRDHDPYTYNATKNITMIVMPQFTRGVASILSEVMMYVTIIGLQLWLLVEMIYCYRKISAAGEAALRESEAEYLSESKDQSEDDQVAE